MYTVPEGMLCWQQAWHLRVKPCGALNPFEMIGAKECIDLVSKYSSPNSGHMSTGFTHMIKIQSSECCDSYTISSIVAFVCIILVNAVITISSIVAFVCIIIPSTISRFLCLPLITVKLS